MTESQLDTLDHIDKVDENLKAVARNLAIRRYEHDASKLEDPELSGFESLRVTLADVAYGTDEYIAALRQGRDTIAHHYAHNRHHPEHWPLGVNSMSLLDIIEMLADWKAAGERTKDGSMAKSLEINFKRFAIDEQLAGILINTARELGWL
jgi:hypothetical protein